MNRILESDATGFIGIEVACQLSDMGFQPRLMFLLCVEPC